MSAISKPAESSTPASSGVAGLDEILNGGFPPDQLYLIQGDPGTGKTTTALQFLLEGVRRGERVLFIALSETKEELESVGRSHGWSLEGMNIFELSTAQQNRPGEQNTLFLTSEVELTELTQVLLNEVERLKPARIVVDSLSELRLLAQNPLRFRRQLFALKQHFIGKKCTVLLLDDRLGSREDAQAHTAAHGLVELEQLSPEYGAERRRVRVLKLRGVKFRGGWHDYAIVRGGLKVFPRLVVAEQKPEIISAVCPSGLPELDTLLGGGADRGTSMLIVGPAGAGKTSIAMQYAAAAIERGERAALFLFDENIRTLLTRATNLGMSLLPFVNDGRLIVRHIDPAEMQPGEFVSIVRHTAEKQEARVILIDSLNGYVNAMPKERFLVTHMHELLSYLAQRDVLSILTMAQHGVLGRMESPLDVSYVADTVLMLRYFESQGAIHQALSVMKKRTGLHERTIREFVLTSQGIKVGQPLVDFQGILTGVPTYTGKSVPPVKQRKTKEPDGR